MIAEPGGPVRRLGVAVELPEPWASTLADARRHSGDPRANDMAPHVTLVPPFRTDEPLEGIVAVLKAAAKGVDSFELHLHGTGTFRPVSDVVFVAVAKGIGQLELLAERLRVPPLDPPRLFPYHPHVTVAQDVPPEALDAVYDSLASFEARFSVKSFQLFEFEPAENPPRADGRKWTPILDVTLG